MEWNSKCPFTYEASKPGDNVKPQEVIKGLDKQLGLGKGENGRRSSQRVSASTICG